MLQNDDPSTRLSSQSTHLTASKVGSRLSRAQSSGHGSAIGYLFCFSAMFSKVLILYT